MPDADLPLDDALLLAHRLAEAFQADPRVEAVVLGGSRTSGVPVDARSDIDLYVYSEEGGFPLDQRQAIVASLGGAERASLGLTFWGDGDVWVHAGSGVEVDVIYSSKRWLEESLERLLVHHGRSGDTNTGIWHSVRSSRILFDRAGWFARLQSWSDRPYPPELRRAIIQRHLPLLRAIVPSYRWNIEKSLPRRDLIFINNEITWLLASCFEVLFALNWVPHPGAKRLLEQVERLCPRRPPDLAGQVNDILRLAALGDEGLLAAIDRLVDGLEVLLQV